MINTPQSIEAVDSRHTMRRNEQSMLALHEAFMLQAQRTPDAVALVYDDQHLTYECLRRRSRRLAACLRELGVGPDVCVGLFLERSPDLVVGMLGTLMSGGAYLPLDPAYPAERLAYILADSRLQVLLTHDRVRSLLPVHSCLEVRLDTEWPQAPDTCDDFESPLDGESLAYVLFTSGSSGRPKAAGIPHRAIVNHMLWMTDAFAMNAGDVVLQKTPFSFDASVWEFHAPLISGGKLVLLAIEDYRDVEGLARTMERYQVTIVQFVPSLLAQVLQEPSLKNCASVRLVFIGGEVCTAPLYNGVRAQLNATTVNLYGVTECSIDSTFWSGELERGSSSTPIGRPIRNTQVYVVESSGEPAPIGIPGELCIGGLGLARGYSNEPALTADRFVPDAFSGAAGARLYRTGDLARWRSDGALEYLGRADQQVKLRGYRIELGEIEAVLMQEAGIRQAAVVLREDALAQPRLVAYVAAEHASEDRMTSLRSALRRVLPEYMVPAVILGLDRLPLTPSGKVDRRALPAPEQRAADAATSIAPRDDVEETLARIWSGVLRRPSVGVTDNFFELGGDSILSLQIVARARQAGLVLTVRQMFEHPTIEALARVTEIRLATPPPVSEGEMPLTPIQQRFAERTVVDPHHFNQALIGELSEAVTVRQVRQIVAAWLQYHDALRLRVVVDAGRWRQQFAACCRATPVVIVDLSGITASAQAAAIATVTTQSQTSLNLMEGPVLRVVWIERGGGQPPLLLLILHHWVVDGVSWRVLLDDFQQAHAQLARREPIAWPPKSASYQEWAWHLRRVARTPAVEQTLTYWCEQGGGGRVPTDHEIGRNTAGSARRVSVALSPNETRAFLAEVPRAYRTQVTEVLLTAVMQALHEWTGERVWTIELEGHGREDLGAPLDVSRTVGWFTSVYPARMVLPAAADLGAALTTIKEQLRAVPQHGISYGLLRYLHPEMTVRARLYTAPAEISFNYLGQWDAIASGLPLWRMTSHPTGAAHSPWQLRAYLLDISGFVHDGRLQMHWGYSAHLHRRESIQRFASSFLDHLRALIAHCTAPEAGGFTPSDFPEFHWKQADLDALGAAIKGPRGRFQP